MPVEKIYIDAPYDPDNPSFVDGYYISAYDLPALAREAAEEIFRRFDVLARPDLDQTPYPRNVFHPEIEKVIMEKWGIK